MRKLTLIIQGTAFIALALGLALYAGEQASDSAVTALSTKESSEPNKKANAPKKTKKDSAAILSALKPSDPKAASPVLQVTTYKPDKVFAGYNLIPLTGAEQVVLATLEGKIVHTWHVDATRARLLPNGNLLVIHGSKWGLNKEPWKKLREHVREYDWDGNVVWEYVTPDIAHHDVQRLSNGNTLFPFRKIVPAEYKQKIYDQNRRTSQMRSDAIVEVSPEGKLVWEWNAHDHLDLNSCGRKSCRDQAGHGGAKRVADWTHINTTSIIPENKWYDQGDKRFKPGNILTLPRNWWTVLLVDKDSKEVVWRYEGDYRGGLSGGHEAHMIPKGRPGAGNILVFDNGRSDHKDQSFILEIDPTTKKVEWVYDAGKEFFSMSAGSMERLPNGNTYISEDVRQRAFEITPEKEIVWEMKSPDYMLSRSARYTYDYSPKFEGLPR